MEIDTIRSFGRKWGKDIAIFFIFLSVGLIIGTIVKNCGKPEEKKEEIQTHVTDPIAGYGILQEFSTKVSDFSTNKEWNDKWKANGYFGVVNTIITRKSTGDTISNVACIVREKEYLRSVKQDMYDGAVDIIEATKEFDSIKTD